MNSIILRVINNPKSKTSLLCFANDIKPFTLPKAKHKNLKPGTYVADLKINPVTNFVFGVKVWQQLATTKKQKKK
jgi:hypothetical protein